MRTIRRWTLGCLSVVYAGSIALGQSTQTAKLCSGPVANVQMRVSPTCEQAWAWHIFLTVAIRDFQGRRALFDAAEMHSIRGEQIFDNAVMVGDALSSVIPSSSSIAGIVKSTIKQAPWTAFDFFGQSAPGNVQVAASLVDTVHSMYEAAMSAGLEPWSVAFSALDVWNKSAALLQTVAVTRSRQTVNMVQELLLEYFRFGENFAPVATALGLPADATVDQIVSAKAKVLRYGPTDFSAASAAEIIRAYQSTIHRYAVACAASASCTAPRTQTYQVAGVPEVPGGAVAAGAPIVVSAASRMASTGEGCNEAVVKPGLSGREAVLSLGSVTQHNRMTALAALVHGNMLRIPQCADEIAAMLDMTTGGFRAESIMHLLPVIKSGLSGQEASLILGAAEQCGEHDRTVAIAQLAQAKKFRPGLSGEELALILKGTTGGYRSDALAALSAK